MVLLERKRPGTVLRRRHQVDEREVMPQNGGYGVAKPGKRDYYPKQKQSLILYGYAAYV